MIKKKKNKSIKGIFIACGLGSLVFMGTSSPASASCTGVCSNCHTMHNSQNGAPVTGDGIPRPFLGNFGGSTSCWGCHGKNSTDNIDPVNGAPQIRHTNNTDLAGGNFAYITGDKPLDTGDVHTVGHNVKDIHEDDGNYDSNFDGGTYPPGDVFTQAQEGFDKFTFTCAGKYGCHGDRNQNDEYLAMYGAHHTGDSMLKFGTINEGNQGGTAGTSYRFLKGVKGGEDSNWEATKSSSDHNEYKGAPTAIDGTKISPGGNTMSGLCAECHGNFHRTTGTGTASPWLRHPTDISLPATGEYASYTTYDPSAPVGRTSIPNAPSNEIHPDQLTDDIVMCLSCHRPHASKYRDILRWRYEDMNAGAGAGANGTGCFICHTLKDE